MSFYLVVVLFCCILVVNLKTCVMVQIGKIYVNKTKPTDRVKPFQFEKSGKVSYSWVGWSNWRMMLPEKFLERYMLESDVRDSNLLEPNVKYENYIINSAHYLNCPKHMLNHDLDCVYRQGITTSKQQSIDNVKIVLDCYDFPHTVKTATKWVEWRDSISIQMFNKINPNWDYKDLPKHVQQRHEFLNDWFERHTDYKSGYKNVQSYPFQRK